MLCQKVMKTVLRNIVYAVINFLEVHVTPLDGLIFSHNKIEKMFQYSFFFQHTQFLFLQYYFMIVSLRKFVVIIISHCLFILLYWTTYDSNGYHVDILHLLLMETFSRGLVLINGKIFLQLKFSRPQTRKLTSDTLLHRSRPESYFSLATVLFQMLEEFIFIGQHVVSQCIVLRLRNYKSSIKTFSKPSHVLLDFLYIRKLIPLSFLFFSCLTSVKN